MVYNSFRECQQINNTFMSGKRSVITSAFRSPRRYGSRLASVVWFLLCESSSTFAEPTRATASTSRLRDITTTIIRTTATAAVLRKPAALFIVYRSTAGVQTSTRLSMKHEARYQQSLSSSWQRRSDQLAAIQPIWSGCVTRHPGGAREVVLRSADGLTATIFGCHASDARRYLSHCR